MPGITEAVISAGSSEAAAAGARIAREGGNAVDIAVAAALAATVSETLMCSLGGSAFVMTRLDGRDPELFEGGDAVPGLAADPGAAPPSARDVHLPYGGGIVVRAGHATIAVPGALAGLELAWRTRGSLPWSEITAPALETARNGYHIGATPARWLAIAGDLLFRQHPASRASFFVDDGPVGLGALVRLPGIDDAMASIAAEGAAALYEGGLAAAFAREMREGGGLVTREDLARYRAVIRKPQQLRSCGFEMAVNPPPAIGGAALKMIIERLDDGWRDDSGDAERALLHARAQTALIDFKNSAHTTHLSVATAVGDLAAVTMSNGYGSGVSIPGTGIACNNSLGEPELHPKGFGTSAPGIRLMSNMAPTVAWHADGRCVALGSPGASRITTAIAQVWTRFVHEGKSWTDAVAAPRLHVEPLDDGHRAQCEPGVDAGLLERDFTVRRFEGPDMFFGAVQLAARERDGRLTGVADKRRDGACEFTS